LESSSGSFAMFAAIRRASSLLSILAADRRPGSFLEIEITERLTVGIAHGKTRGLFLDRPGRREASLGAYNCEFPSNPEIDSVAFNR